jgi:hypothetical protein
MMCKAVVCFQKKRGPHLATKRAAFDGEHIGGVCDVGAADLKRHSKRWVLVEAVGNPNRRRPTKKKNGERR